MVPAGVLESLGIERRKVWHFRQADGTVLARWTGWVCVYLVGTSTVDEVVFGQPGDLVLLGSRSLEGLNLRFFDRALFAELFHQHRRLRFAATDLQSPFDSQLVGGRPGVQFGSELFFAPIWQAYLSALSDVPLRRPGVTHVMMRRHRPRANGIWLHTDHNVDAPVTSGVFIYLNRGWTVSDGGILQFWRLDQRCGVVKGTPAPIRWVGKKGRRLTFLTRRHKLFIEVGNARNQLEAMRFTLVDQVLPLYNRLVVCDFVSDPAYHSVTPGNTRPRYDITQRLY